MIAAHIHAAACARLEAAGERPTAVAVAALLGLHPQAWRRYVAGHVAPTVPTVEAWLTTLSLRASFDGTEWTIEG